MWTHSPVISSSRIWSLFLLLAVWCFTASEGKLDERRNCSAHNSVNRAPLEITFWLNKNLLLLLAARRFKRKAIDVECQEIGKYYRNPDVSKQNCYTYYYCLGGTVFEYSCSGGLMFDIRQQICNFEDQVKNCNTTAGTPVPLSNSVPENLFFIVWITVGTFKSRTSTKFQVPSSSLPYVQL